jgi:hypothetical protein
MSELKTKKTDQKVQDFLDTVSDDTVRRDCHEIVKIMQEVTGEPPAMWGASIVGFGTYHYKYASGREGDWMVVGFSPRKQNLTLYVMDGFSNYDTYLKKLGHYTTGKSCLYIKRLGDVDTNVLKEMIKASVASIKKTYG